MGDRGAVTLAIEALKKLKPPCKNGNPEYVTMVSDDTLLECKQALEALKAFKDGVPEGLGDNVENIIIHNQYIETKEVKADIMVFYKAGKHLQEGVK